MSEPTPSPENPEPATGPVTTTPLPAPPPGHSQESNRLNKAAAWVGVIAGSVIIIAVIFGTGFFVGKGVGEGSRGHDRANHMVLHPGPPMSPMGPRGEFERGPGFPGPFGPGGPMIDVPRSPGGSGGPDATTGAPRP